MKSLFALLPLLIGQPINLPEIQKQPFSLKLDQEVYLTDINGLLNPITISNVKPGESVRIYLVNGVCFNAFVKEIVVDTVGVIKIFGEMTNFADTKFGFLLAKDGTFAGAIVQKNPNVMYQMVYSEAAKGYIFEYSSNF